MVLAFQRFVFLTWNCNWTVSRSSLKMYWPIFANGGIVNKTNDNFSRKKKVGTPGHNTCTCQAITSISFGAMAFIGANGVCADSILVAVVIISSTFIEIWFKNQLINNCSSINPPIDCQLTFFNKNKVKYIYYVHMTQSVKTAVDDGLTLKSVCSASWILPAIYNFSSHWQRFSFSLRAFR